MLCWKLTRSVQFSVHFWVWTIVILCCAGLVWIIRDIEMTHQHAQSIRSHILDSLPPCFVILSWQILVLFSFMAWLKFCSTIIFQSPLPVPSVISLNTFCNLRANLVWHLFYNVYNMTNRQHIILKYLKSRHYQHMLLCDSVLSRKSIFSDDISGAA